METNKKTYTPEFEAIDIVPRSTLIGVLYNVMHEVQERNIKAFQDDINFVKRRIVRIASLSNQEIDALIKLVVLINKVQS